MAYLGNSPQQSVRQRYHYTATAGQTTFSGTDIYGLILKYQDNEYVDVYLNGVLLQKIEDYTATSRTSVVLSSGAQVGDLVEIVVYGVFSVSDTVSASRGGTFTNAVNVSSNLVVSGNVNVSSDLAVTGNLRVGTGSVVITNNTVTIAGSAVSPVQSFRNKVINGNFDHWQRETSNTSVTSGQYVADRFRTSISGSTANVSRQAFTLGQTGVPNEPSYFHRTVVTSVAGSGNFCVLAQTIESVRTLAGQTATLSFWAKADATKNIAVEFFQYFGSGGSPSSIVSGINVTTCSLTTSWQKFVITVSLPSISGKTLGTNNDDWLAPVFWFDAGSNFNSRSNSLGQQSGTFDIAQVQLEAGSVATPFEVRPLGVELQLCQRYYQVFNGQIDTAQNGSGSSYATWFFNTRTRATPTITQSGINITGQNNISADSAQWYSSAAALRITSATASAEL